MTHDLTPTPRGGRLSAVAVIRPHILIVLITLIAAIYPLRGIIVAAVHLWWGSTYRAVDFVMDEARPNGGSPYIAGHLDGATDQTNLSGMMIGDVMAVKLDPSQTFGAGKPVKIWHSDAAPNIVVFGSELNDIPVVALPERPGLGSLLLHLGLLWLVLVVGLRLAAWVANRWSGVYTKTITLPS